MVEIANNSFLPDGILSQFVITDIQELEQVKLKRVSLFLHLAEKNILPAGYNLAEYESKAFCNKK
jgi:hypothetical protein